MKKTLWRKPLAILIALAVALSVTAQMGAAAYASVTPPPATVTITYDANGGKAVAPVTVTVGSALGVLPTTTKAKYSLVGWFTAPSGGTQITGDTVATASVTYYAHWTITKKTVTLNANKGDMKGAATAQFTANYGKNYGSNLVKPTRTGYTFTGWYTAKSGGVKVTKSTIVTTTKAKQTLYAHWTAKVYTVTFKANGGMIGAVKTLKIPETYGKKYILPANPVRSKYRFLGWFTEKEGGTQITSFDKVAITENSTFYAQWDSMLNPVFVVDTLMLVTGTGSGWHGKIVIKDDNTSISFGIQHDAESTLGYPGKDALVLESNRNSPAYHNNKAFKTVSSGWHELRLEWSKKDLLAKGYCDGVYVGEVSTQSLGSNVSINWVAVPKESGDTVDVSFKNTFVDTNDYKYGGLNTYWQSNYGNYQWQKIGTFVNNPHQHSYYDNGTGYRIWGTANIPNEGNWTSYPTTGARMWMNWTAK